MIPVSLEITGFLFDKDPVEIDFTLMLFPGKRSRYSVQNHGLIDQNDTWLQRTSYDPKQTRFNFPFETRDFAHNCKPDSGRTASPGKVPGQPGHKIHPA